MTAQPLHDWSERVDERLDDDVIRENTRYQFSFGPNATSLLRAAMADADAANVVNLIYVESRRASIRELVDRVALTVT